MLSKSWNERWLSLAQFISGWSKDRSRKTGCVIVDERNTLLAIGWNGFPRGVDDDVSDRHQRPAKYSWTEHAERNAINNAAAHGIRLLGATLFIPWFPCADCTRGIIQAGIGRLVAVTPEWEDTRFNFMLSRDMLVEAGVEIVLIDDLGFEAPLAKEVIEA